MKSWNNMSDTWKAVTIGLSAVVAIVVMLMIFVPMSYRNSIADQEVVVQEKVQACAVKIDNGAKAIVQQVQVDVNTKNFITGIFDKAAKSPNSQLAKDIDGAYVQFVEGNVNPMLILMSTLSGSDITITSQNVQREITAQRAIMSACSVDLLGAQAQLRKTLGYDASNRRVKFPQKHINLQPSVVQDLSLLDNDHDGRITVLDYRPPVDLATIQSFNTGEAVPLPDLYNTNP